MYPAQKALWFIESHLAEALTLLQQDKTHPPPW